MSWSEFRVKNYGFQNLGFCVKEDRSKRKRTREWIGGLNGLCGFDAVWEIAGIGHNGLDPKNLRIK